MPSWLEEQRQLIEFLQKAGANPRALGRGYRQKHAEQKPVDIAATNAGGQNLPRPATNLDQPNRGNTSTPQSYAAHGPWMVEQDTSLLNPMFGQVKPGYQIRHRKTNQTFTGHWSVEEALQEAQRLNQVLPLGVNEAALRGLGVQAKMPHEQEKTAHYDAMPSGMNTFVPGLAGSGSRNPDMYAANSMETPRTDAGHAQRIGFAAPFGMSYAGGPGEDYKSPPRTVTINHPGRNVSKIQYIDPQEAAYAARYGSYQYQVFPGDTSGQPPLPTPWPFNKIPGFSPKKPEAQPEQPAGPSDEEKQASALSGLNRALRSISSGYAPVGGARMFGSYGGPGTGSTALKTGGAGSGFKPAQSTYRDPQNPNQSLPGRQYTEISPGQTRHATTTETRSGPNMSDRTSSRDVLPNPKNLPTSSAEREVTRQRLNESFKPYRPSTGNANHDSLNQQRDQVDSRSTGVMARGVDNPSGGFRDSVSPTGQPGLSEGAVRRQNNLFK